MPNIFQSRLPPHFAVASTPSEDDVKHWKADVATRTPPCALDEDAKIFKFAFFSELTDIMSEKYSGLEKLWEQTDGPTILTQLAALKAEVDEVESVKEAQFDAKLSRDTSGDARNVIFGEYVKMGRKFSFREPCLEQMEQVAKKPRRE